MLFDTSYSIGNNPAYTTHRQSKESKLVPKDKLHKSAGENLTRQRQGIRSFCGSYSLESLALACVSMSSKGRWAAGAPALIVFVWLNASCLSSSAVSVGEGTKWNSWLSRSSGGAYPSYTPWDKVTAVLEEARKNATFPGIVQILIMFDSCCVRVYMHLMKGRGSLIMNTRWDQAFTRCCPVIIIGN